MKIINIICILHALAIKAVLSQPYFDPGTVFSDYMEIDEPDFGWVDTGIQFNTLFGGRAHVLNVTSLRWLNDTIYEADGGNLWAHQVTVIVPKELTYRNMSNIYIASIAPRKNWDPITTSPFDLDLLVADGTALQTGAICAVVYQNPSNPMVFKSDTGHRHRSEDDLIAWSFHDFMYNEVHDPHLIVMLPIVKASFQVMKAIEQFTVTEKMAEIESWIFIGASKRGWATYLAGAVAHNCTWCSKLSGIIPLVPIMPDMTRVIHRQWQAYGGFSFAFQPYLDAGLLDKIDHPIFAEAFGYVDPINYGEGLSHVPGLILVTTDDEFMMMDWTNMYYDYLTGEKHLLIVPNTDHILFTNLYAEFSTIGSFVRSIMSGAPPNSRPTFTYEYNPENGEIKVKVSEEHNHKISRVVLRHAETMQSNRRDFRWLRQASDITEPCEDPMVPIPSSISTKPNCLNFITWSARVLKESAFNKGEYTATPPEPKTQGHWVGYYVQIFWLGDTKEPSWLLNGEYNNSTPGYTWPNTLPFPDCDGLKGECKRIIV